jgi:hypothetical protein
MLLNGQAETRCTGGPFINMASDQLKPRLRSNARASGDCFRVAMGRSLTRLYDKVLTEPLPYQLKSLMAKLARKGSTRDPYEGSL